MADGYLSYISGGSNVRMRQTARSTDFETTGDIEVIMCLYLPDWRPASEVRFYTNTGGSLGHELRLKTDGVLRSLYREQTNTTTRSYGSGTAVEADATPATYWIRQRIYFDGSGGHVAHYKSSDATSTDPDSVSWGTALADAVVDAADTAISANNTTPCNLLCDSAGNANPDEAKLYYFRLKENTTTISELDFRVGNWADLVQGHDDAQSHPWIIDLGTTKEKDWSYAPTTTAPTKAGTVEIQAIYFDNVTANSAISTPRYKVDAGSWNNLTWDATNGWWDASLDTTTLSNGTRTITVEGTDGNSNVGDNTFDINVQNGATVTITNPTNSSTVSGTVTVQATVSGA